MSACSVTAADSTGLGYGPSLKHGVISHSGFEIYLETPLCVGN